MDLITRTNDTQETNFESFTQDVQAFLDLVGNLSTDDTVIADNNSKSLDLLSEKMTEVMAQLLERHDQTKSSLEQLIIKIDKIVDLRGMGEMEEYYYADGYALTDEAYLAERIKLKAAVDSGELDLAKWAEEATLLQYRHIGNPAVRNDVERRFSIFIDHDFSDSISKAAKVASSLAKAAMIKVQLEDNKANSESEAEKIKGLLDAGAEELTGLETKYAAETAKYAEEKAKAEQALKEAEKASEDAWKIYQDETDAAKIAPKFQDYLDKRSKEMDARIAHSRIVYSWAARSMGFERNIDRLKQAIPGYDSAFKSLSKTVDKGAKMIAMLQHSISQIVQDAVSGNVSELTALLAKKDGQWASGADMVESGEWSNAAREFHANFFIRNDEGSLVDPKIIERIKGYYEAAAIGS